MCGRYLGSLARVDGEQNYGGRVRGKNPQCISVLSHKKVFDVCWLWPGPSSALLGTSDLHVTPMGEEEEEEEEECGGEMKENVLEAGIDGREVGVMRNGYRKETRKGQNRRLEFRAKDDRFSGLIDTEKKDGGEIDKGLTRAS